MGQTNLMYAGIHFDSDEEVFFAMWLDEMFKAGYVEFWQRPLNAMPITGGLKMVWIKKTQQKRKVKEEAKALTLLRLSSYTHDFDVMFTEQGTAKFVNDIDIYKITQIADKEKPFFKNIDHSSVTFEVKGSFNIYNMTRSFELNQKFIWDKYKIFVNLVVPIELFKKTFLPSFAEPYFKYKIVPAKAKAKGKKKGDWKMDWIPKTLKQYINGSS